MSRKNIYFIQGEITGLIKIGQAHEPEVRLKLLQIGSPDRLKLLGSMRCFEKCESILHKTFYKDKVHGEWYRSSEKLLEFIAKFTEPNKFA